MKPNEVVASGSRLVGDAMYLFPLLFILPFLGFGEKKKGIERKIKYGKEGR